MTANVVEEGDKGGAGDGTESDAAGNLYATNYEHNAVLPRRPDTEWETIAHDPRLLWPATMSQPRTATCMSREPAPSPGALPRR